ncbi:hypothetical protein [Streptomyces sp. TBY4]|uniref:hypothetical protein n=1 Tax=Streptomyces sp. TBY4 TaxID=2962030 RepID=UPI0020B68AB3|nr:hypothetical protein [Streptomyces sp. TBY4]MCP3759535.1 hypothetical protein [Streptomyces sp. TBY4]
MKWLNEVNTVFGVLGFLITLVTFLKVQSVQRAQREERQLLRRLYGTEMLAAQLRSAAGFLRQGTESDARMLAEELVRVCGQIEGISRALDSLNRERRSVRGESNLVPNGYYTPAFLNRAVNDAQHQVDFLIYRNLQFANVDLLQSMERAARRGVRIRILGLSSRAEDAVLDQASMVLPWPQAEPAVLRRQLSDSEERIRSIVEGWGLQSRGLFEYRGYLIAPNAHFARTDGVVRQGFIGTLSSAQPAGLEERGYMEFRTSAEPGATLSRHFEQLWARSAENVVAGG